jgi:hypothetical protein
MSNNTKIERLSFYCSRMNSEVTITMKMLIRKYETGVDKKIPLEADCNSKDNCGIAKEGTTCTTYDYSKCVHPEIKKRL